MSWIYFFFGLTWFFLIFLFFFVFDSIDLRRFEPRPDASHRLGFPSPSKGRKRGITVKPWTTIKDLKDRLSSLLHVPSASQRLYYGPSHSLKNARNMQDIGVYKGGATFLLEIVGSDVSGGKRVF